VATRKKAAAKKAPAKKAPAKKAPAKRAPVKKARERATGDKAATKKAPRRKGARADLGAPIEGFFAKQPPQLRAILDKLRKLIDEVVPEADASIKWGMPFYTLNGTMMCALTSHRAHVNLVLAGPPDSYADPEGRLEGHGKTGRHLRLTSLAELPTAAVRGWLRTAAETARA
jgi:hypothetical protein